MIHLQVGNHVCVPFNVGGASAALTQDILPQAVPVRVPTERNCVSVRTTGNQPEAGDNPVVEERPAYPLTLALFGPFDVRIDGRPLPRLRSQKGQWLLALLVLQHGRTVERTWL